MFFESWASLGRVLLVGSLAYIGLVLLLRVSGKRTLSKLNAFDLVVTVALGSTLATVLLSRDVPLLDGLLAFALLIFAQFIITWISTRSPAFRKVVTSQPRLLVYRGQILREALTEERLTLAEIHAVIRNAGVASMEDVGAVVLESDASLNVLKLESRPPDPAILGNVIGYEPDRHAKGGAAES